jgi:signal peptidase I
MAPVLSVGDVVLVKTVEHPEEGSAVLIRTDGQGALFHRIVSWNEDGTATTKGDANAAADSTPVTEDQIVGVGRVAVPAIGLPVVWLASGDYLRLGLSVLCELMIIVSARSMRASAPIGLGAGVPLSAFHLRQLRRGVPSC